MKYESTKTVPSKIAPDVTYTLKRMNGYRRDELEEVKQPFEDKLQPLRDQLEVLEPQIAPLRAELEPLTEEYRQSFERAKAAAQAEIDALIAEGVDKDEADKRVPIGKLDFPDDRFERWRELKKEISALRDPITKQMRKIDRNELTPAAVKFVTVRIDGLEIDGEAATVDSLRKNGQDELYEELATAVARELGLLPAEISNLSSPPTLVGVEGQTSKTNGSAAPAESAETIMVAAV